MTDRQQQWFHFGPWAFSIDAAFALIAAKPRAARAVDVATWATAYASPTWTTGTAPRST
jgi:hypothetical protein